MSVTANSDGEFEFELNGHHYEGMQHGAEEGFALALKLHAAMVDPIVTILGGPLLAAIASPDLVASLQAAAEGGDSDVAAALIGADAGELAKALGSLDMVAVSGGLKSVMGAFDMPTVKAILAHTTRDHGALRDPHVFDRAYRGNYAEAVQAAWKVAQGNAFAPALGTIVTGLKGLAAPMVQQSAQKPGPVAVSRSLRRQG